MSKHHTTESVERLAWRVHESKAGREVRSDAVTTLRDLAAERDHLLAAQSYTYIGKDGKPVLARDLEDERDALRARLDEAERARSDLREKVSYLCECAYHHADKFPVPGHMRKLVEEIRAFLNGGGNG